MKFFLKTMNRPIKLKSKVHHDKRGYLIETLSKKKYLNVKFSLLTMSKKNVFRGLHYQKFYSQAKLIFLVKGKIIDYCLDIRKKSKNYGRLYKFNLNKNESLFIPKGFAHGYKSLDQENILMYYMDNFRYQKYESGFLHKDISLTGFKISNKDKFLPLFNK